jgi:hypothetical protein
MPTTTRLRRDTAHPLILIVASPTQQRVTSIARRCEGIWSLKGPPRYPAQPWSGTLRVQPPSNTVARTANSPGMLAWSLAFWSTVTNDYQPRAPHPRRNAARPTRSSRSMQRPATDQENPEKVNGSTKCAVCRRWTSPATRMCEFGRYGLVHVRYQGQEGIPAQAAQRLNRASPVATPTGPGTNGCVSSSDPPC